MEKGSCRLALETNCALVTLKGYCRMTCWESCRSVTARGRSNGNRRVIAIKGRGSVRDGQGARGIFWPA